MSSSLVRPAARSSRRHPLRFARTLAALVLLAACGGGGDGASDDGDPVGPPPPPPSATVAVSLTPTSASLAAGATQQLQATVTGSSNTGVTWSSTQPSVATVSSTGLVTAVAPGLTTIRATSVADASKSQAAAITVTTGTGGGGGGGTPSGTVLTSGAPVTGLAAAEDAQNLYRIVVPAGATRLEVRTSGGTGDLDLYLRQGQAPAAGQPVACASESATNTETCVITNPTAGDWYVLLVAFEAYGGVTLTATVTAGGGSSTPGFTLAANPASVTVARGGSATFAVTATRTGGFTGSIDLNTEGFATGISGGSGITINGNQTTVTMVINASTAATPGTSTVTVRGRATGLADQTIPVSVTVPASTGNAVLTTRTTGAGQGTVSPAGGEYTPGSLLIVDGTPHTYSAFKGWTTSSTHCGGNTGGGCRITVGTQNILMEARFEPITWSTNYDLEYVSSLTTPTAGCKWNVKWIGARVDINFVRQVDGSYRGKLRFSGRRVASVAETTGSGTCNPSDNTISRSVDFAATGRAVSVRFDSFSGAGTEYTTVGISDLAPGTPGTTLGGIGVEYTGTGRSGSGGINLLGFSQSSPP